MAYKSLIFNDPVHGFVSVNDPLIAQLIDHPWYQRLRRIKQLGLTNLVYPGALHTRFHHAIGAMHLMAEAIDVLRSKGNKISDEERRGALIAILLHDIGHGPFSHSLEHSIVHGVTHEDISELFMDRLNKEFKGQLSTAISIFRDEHPKKFLHQLVSSQLDVDRLDYLVRDSFFTGVSEGVISAERIVKMMNVGNNELVVEAKGIYSIEKFILARRLMYWQVYLHKTVLSAENLLVRTLKRAKELAGQKKELFCSPALHCFLYNKYSKKDFLKDPTLLQTFADLDDNDIISAIKVWMKHKDTVLSTLCTNLIQRRLYRVELQKEPFSTTRLKDLREKVKKKLKINDKEAEYFVVCGEVSNDTYRADEVSINILFKDGKILDISEASDQMNLEVLSKTIRKHYLCYPKE